MLNIMLSLWVTSRVAPPAGAGATTGWTATGTAGCPAMLLGSRPFGKTQITICMRLFDDTCTLPTRSSVWGGMAPRVAHPAGAAATTGWTASGTSGCSTTILGYQHYVAEQKLQFAHACLTKQGSSTCWTSFTHASTLSTGKSVWGGMVPRVAHPAGAAAAG